MAISVPGLGSNLDVNSIVSQLMAIEQRPLLLLDAKEADYQAQLSAYGQLRGALSALQTAVNGLADLTRFQARSASVGDGTVLSASATPGATAATYEIAVTQLAQQQSVSSTGQASLSAPLGSGATTVLTFQFGTISGGTLSNGVYTGATFTQNGSIATGTVTIDASNNTLQGIRDAINAADIGVTASILNVGGSDPYRLVLQSNSGGSAGSLQIGVSGDATLESLLAYDPAGTQNLTQTVVGQDAQLTVNGLAVSSGSNRLTDVIEGVTLSLAKLGTTSVTIGQDSAGAQQAVQAFVKAYNDLNTLLGDLTRFDAETQSRGVLTGDSAARTIQSQLRNALSSALTGSGDSLRVLSQVGVSFQKDGSLALDSGKLAQAIATDSAAVARLFASGGSASDSLIEVVGSSAATIPGVYAVDITQLATRGQLVGSAAAALTITTGVDDVLTVTVDGTSTEITLPAGTYTASSLAAQVQSLVNATSTLKAADAGVTVSESAGVLTVTSKRYGSASTVSVSGTAATALFGAGPTATAGVDVAGTIGGLPAVGSGQRLTAAGGGATSGLVLEITGGSTGARGTASFARGYAARLDALLEGALASNGTISSRTSGINATIDDIDSQREVLNRRLALIEQRYRAQFVALDTLLGQLSATSTFLAQQLALLPGAGNLGD
jgi:flagellar hook-associated protein 2